MERIKHFKQSLDRFLKKPKDVKNQQVVNGWYQSYQPLEKFAFNEVDKNKLREQLRQGIFPHLTTPKNYRLWWFTSAAALVLISGAAIYTAQKQQQVKAPAYVSSVTQTGMLKHLVLADSSEVWLNASSKFRYPIAFNKKQRLVYLPEGEAFFKVKHNSSKPFLIRLGKLEVKVLGTSFNINNYAGLTSQTIVVNTGKVQVADKGKILATLTKGKQLSYNKATSKFRVDDVDQNLSFSWRDGKTILQEASFSALSMVFKNLYGVKLRSELDGIQQFRYTLTVLRQVPLEENLALICKMHHIKYRKEGNVIVLY